MSVAKTPPAAGAADVLSLLEAYPCRDRQDREARQQTADFVRANPDCLLRSNLAGHLTAAGCVLDRRRARILLVHHRKLGRWLQPGGHADGNPDLLAVALDEVREETGVTEIIVLAPEIFDLDVHPIPARGGTPEHLHYDVRFLLGADSTAPLSANHEVWEAAWVPLEDVEELTPDTSVHRLAAKARRWLGDSGRRAAGRSRWNSLPMDLPSPPLRPVGGLLLDLDGTVYEGRRLIPGAAEALAWLRREGVPHLFTNNTTRKPRSEVLAGLRALGVPAEDEQCLTAPMAGAAWLRRRGVRRILPLVAEGTREEFAEFDTESSEPEVVVLGDQGERWSFAALDRAFRALMEGAELLALQRNRYWRRRGELSLDAGAFVAALEYASGRRAHLAGKPSRAFFAAAVERLGVPSEAVAVVGDDPETDIRGALDAGLIGVGVRTGKYRREDEERVVAASDAVLDSLADLPEWLQAGGGREAYE